jgi:hypothetical protein
LHDVRKTKSGEAVLIDRILPGKVFFDREQGAGVVCPGDTNADRKGDPEDEIN